MTSTNHVLGRLAAVSVTSAALVLCGVTAAHAEAADGTGQGTPPAHSQAGGHSNAGDRGQSGDHRPQGSGSQGAQGEPGHQGDPGHQGAGGHGGDPGHQGADGHGGDPGHQGAEGGNPGAADGEVPAGSGHNPPGNNGTIKIEQVAADDVPQNNPHQSCELRVEWYGFDEGDVVESEVSFEPQAPTADSTIGVDGTNPVFVGGDAASGAGTDTGWDGSEVYRLSFTGDPHPQQGYHVKVTVHTPHSLGNDSKSKVFWIEPCEGAGSGVGSGLESGAAGGTLSSGATGVLGSTSGASQGAGAPTTSDAAGSLVAPGATGEGARTDGASGTVPVPTSVDAGTGFDGARDALPFGLLALGSALAAAAVHLRRRATVD